MNTGNERRVLVVAPTGRDAPLICDMLAHQGIECELAPSVAQACAVAVSGVGAMLVTEEALTTQTLQELSELFAIQPKWSDIPVILLASNGDRMHGTGRALLEQRGARGNFVVLERPVRVLALRSAIDAALQTRSRQYELRDHLEELARSEERLRQTQKMESIGILAGGIAHDFNNLLTGVMGNASLAYESLPASSPVRGMLKDVVDASERAAHLTRQLLAYAGKGRFVIRRLDLSQQVREISHLIQTSIPKNVQLRLELLDELPLIEADPAQIQQIVMNLVINGAEAIAEGTAGMVMIGTRIQDVDETFVQATFGGTPIEPGRYVMLEVYDSGVGMDQATMDRIFDPFFTTKFTGRGLGLAAVMGIVRGHHGALKIYSAPGRGSTFKVLFPAKAECAESTSTKERPAHQGAGTVLVIDDEEIVRRTAKAALQRFGYQVEVCESGLMGVEYLNRGGADIRVVLLDMNMPVMGGEETFRRLKSIRPEVPVILSSGYSEMDAMRRFTDKGLAGFIQKPYTASALAEKISSVLVLA